MECSSRVGRGLGGQVLLERASYALSSLKTRVFFGILAAWCVFEA